MIQLRNADDDIPRLERLLAASSIGDHIAFAQFYALTKRKLFRTALSIVKRPEVAEDVLQDAYVKIWRHAGCYNPEKSSPVTWTVTIVRNHALDVIRQRSVLVDSDDRAILNLSDDKETAQESLEAADHRGHALAALRALNPLQRSLIVAAYVQGESREQLAVRFGKPVSTIKTWLRRAILQARISMAEIASG